MKRTYYLLFVILGSFLLPSCINLQVDYPEINLYNLTPPADISKVKSPPNCSVQIRDVEMPDIQRGNKIMITEKGVIKELYYNRWVTNFDDVVSDYLVSSFTKAGAFMNGVLSTRTLQKPDYILEGRILECSVINQKDKKPYEYYVTLSMSFRLLKVTMSTSGYKEILYKTYTSRVEREKDRIKLIPPAVNHAMDNISKELLDDMIEVLNEEADIDSMMR